MLVIELLVQVLFWLFSAAVFIITATLLYRQKHRHNRLLVVLASAFAIVSGVGTLQWAFGFWPSLQHRFPFLSYADTPRVSASGSAVVSPNTKNFVPINVPQRYKIGDRFRDCRNCPPMILLPSGTSTIGRISLEVGGCGCQKGKDALPPVSVVIAYRLAMGARKITAFEWNDCVREKGCAPLWHYAAVSAPEFNSYPAMVSWEAAKNYADWLSRKTQHAYRLPSEAEWEFAARGGTSTAFWWGNKFDERKAPIVEVEREGEKAAPDDEFKAQLPKAIGRYKPNPFGLYDMIGNGMEWVEDCYAEFVPDDWGRPLEDGQARLSEFPRDGTSYQDQLTCQAQSSRDHTVLEHVLRNGNNISLSSFGSSMNDEPEHWTTTTVGTPAPVYARQGASYKTAVSTFRVALTLAE